MSVPVLAAPVFDPGNQRVDLTLSAGVTITDALRAALPSDLLEDLGRIRVTLVSAVGAAEIFPEHWPRIRPRDGVRVVIRVVPGKSALRSVLQIVVSIAAGLAAPMLGGWLAGTFGLSAATWTSIAGLGLTALGGLLINALIPPITSDNDRQNRYTLTGWRNKLDADGAVPVVLGKVRYAPPFAALTYTEIRGDWQYLRTAFTFGYGPLSLSDFKIGETSISEYDEVDIEVREGLATDDPLSIYPRQVIEESVGTELTRPLLRDDSGELVKEDDGTINVGMWVVTRSGDYLSVETPVTRTTASDTASASIILGFPAGLVKYDSKGRARSYTVQIRIEQRLLDADDWTEVDTLSISGSDSDQFFRQYSWALPSRGRWQVRLTKMTAESTNDQVSDGCTWAALQSIRPEYPLNFNEPLALVSVRVKATHQLNGGLDNFSAIVALICPDYDHETGAWVERETSNPAALYRYALQSPANPRPVSDTGIDLSQIEDWHDYCRVNGLCYDRVIDDASMTLRDALTEITAAGRATPRHDGLRWGVTIDRPQDLVVDHISPRNSWDFKASRRYSEPPDGIRVSFVDASNEYQPGERLVPWIGNEDGEITLTEALELPGKTDPDEIWREARRRMYEVIHRPDSYQVTQDGMLRVATRGDLVRVSHDVLDSVQRAARVTRVSGDLIWIDETVEIEAGTSYAIRFQTYDAEDTVGQSQLRTVSAEPGETDMLMLTGSGAAPGVGDAVFFGVAGSETFPAIVTGVETTEDGAAILYLVDAAPQIDELTAADEPPAWSGRIGAEIGLTAQQPSAPRFVFIRSGLDGTGVADRIEYQLEAGSGSVMTARFQIRHRVSGADTWDVAQIAAAEGGGELDYASGSTVELQARGLSFDDLGGPWTPLITITVGAHGADIPEALPTAGVTVTALLGGARVAFSTGDDTATTQVQLYRSDSATLDRETDAVSSPISTVAGRSYTISAGDTTRSNLASGTWTAGAGWTLTATGASHEAGAAGDLSQDVSLTAGKWYRLGLTISALEGGSLTPILTGGTERAGNTLGASGRAVDRIQSVTGNDALTIRADSTAEAVISGAVIYQETASCLSQGTHYFWLESQNDDGVAGPVIGPFETTIE